MKFAANLGFMFQKTDFVLDRYEVAKKAGFKGVEIPFPYSHALENVVAVKEKSGLEQVLINSYPGNLEAGQLGLAALPAYVGEFQSSLDLSIKYCKALNCKRIHVMAGKCMSKITDTGMGAVYLDNLKYAAELFEKEDIIGLIEPINNQTVPGYFLNNFDEAIKYLEKVNSPNLKLQMDIFHLQHVCGNLTRSITNLLPYVGHIQIAQVPYRNEPNSSGEVDYQYILRLIEDLGYDGWIGCEYNTDDDTIDGSKWIAEYGYSL